MPKLEIYPSTRGLSSIGKRGFQHVLYGKISKKTNFFIWRFQTSSKQKCSNLKPLLSIIFPQGFRISKNVGHLTLGSGGKKTFKRYLKSEQTDRHTDRHTDRRTNRLIESIGPEGQCFEKLDAIQMQIQIQMQDKWTKRATNLAKLQVFKSCIA